jgi:hypothetical protein
LRIDNIKEKNFKPKVAIDKAVLQANALGAQIKALDAKIALLKAEQTKFVNSQEYQSHLNSTAFKQRYDKYVTDISALQTQRKSLNAKLKAIKITSPNGNDAPPPPKGTPTPNDDGAPSINISATKENYFSSTELSINKFTESASNFPINVDDAALRKASSLWNTGVSNKGIIKTWQSPTGYTNTQITDKNGSLSNVEQTYLDKTVRGFQFHYNPGSVTMKYKGVPDVDVSMYSANIERFNLMGPSTNQSTISFSLIINRMTDVHYMDNPKNGKFKKESLGDYSSVYNRPPVDGKFDELKAIYEQGTMYDVEFLLRVLLGFQIKSALRNTANGGLTADMGWVSPRPVELHLGNNLKYVVFIGGFDIQHVIFNDRMVPIFSTVSLEMNRIPDYNSITLKKA